MPLIKGVFQLNYLENRGAAFGIMQGRQMFFVVCTVLITILILYLYARMPFTPQIPPAPHMRRACLGRGGREYDRPGETGLCC